MTCRTLLRFLPLLVFGSAVSGCVIELDGDLRGSIRGELGLHCRGDQRVRTLRYDFDEPITAVVIDGGVGDIRVHGHDGDGAAVQADMFGDDGDRRTPRVYLDGQTLRISTECQQGCCGADLDVSVPRGVSLDLGSGVGDVTVTGLQGEVLVDLGTGDVELEDLDGELDVHTGTGSIEGHHLVAADARADVGTGDVGLHWSGLAEIHSIAIDVGVGSVDLAVPAASCDLRLDVGVGSVDLDDVRSDGRAQGTIAVDIGTGDVDIRGI